MTPNADGHGDSTRRLRLTWWDGDNGERCPAPTPKDGLGWCDLLEGHDGDHWYIFDHSPGGEACEFIVWTSNGSSEGPAA